MKKFKETYHWSVLDDLTRGKTVCVCDREWQSCDTLNELTVDKAIAIINDAKQNRDRYTFWIEEKSEEVKE